MLILKLADGYADAFPWIHQLERSNRREQIYAWFIKNKITGKNFIAYIAERRYSLLAVIKSVLSEIDRKKKEELYGGIDLL